MLARLIDVTIAGLLAGTFLPGITGGLRRQANAGIGGDAGAECRPLT